MLLMTEKRPTEQFLTIEQVMQRLQVARVTAWRLIRNGKLRAIKVGRVYRVKEEWLQEYIKSVEENT
jgi:excisionase family DNA binding protein